MYAKLKPISSSKSASRKPKSPHPTSSQQTAELLATERVRLARSKAIAAETRASIDEFESSMKGRVAAASGAQGQDGEGAESGGGDYRRRDADHQSLATGPTADYVAQIKRRVQDSLVAREEREKRRRKVLVEQLKAMHEQEVSLHNTVQPENLAVWQSMLQPPNQNPPKFPTRIYVWRFRTEPPNLNPLRFL